MAASRGSSTLALLQLLAGNSGARNRHRRALGSAFRNAGYMPEFQAPTRWNWERLQRLRAQGAVRPSIGDDFATPSWLNRIGHATKAGPQVAWQPAQRLRWTPGMLLPQRVRRAVQGYQNLRAADPQMATRLRQLIGAGAAGTGALGAAGVMSMQNGGTNAAKR